MKAKILLYDLETSAIEGSAWRRYDTNLIKVKRDWQLLSFSYRWLGEGKVECFSRRTLRNEKALVAKLHSVLNRADMTVTHNGVSFDNKKANAKFAEFFLPPVLPSAQVDTCRLARSVFGFTSNSLDDLCQRLGLGKKLKYKGGYEIWDAAVGGDAAALKKMERYNKHDVVLLDKLYKRLRPYAKNLPNMSVVEGYVGCPSCKSTNAQRRGIAVTLTVRKQRWQCKDCGHWFMMKPTTTVGDPK